MGKSVAIGLSNLHYAILTVDRAPRTNGAEDAGEIAYEAPIRLSGAITANFSPNASNDTLFADDGPYDTASTLGAMSLELNVADIPPSHRATLLGSTYDTSTGLVVDSSEDIPPYVAVGCSVKKSNGYDRLIWYLKGKFSAPDDNNQTKSDSINWNTPTITGNFLKRDYDNNWRFSVDTDDDGYTGSKTDFTNWFKASTLVAGDYSGGGSTLTVTVAPTTAPVTVAPTEPTTSAPKVVKKANPVKVKVKKAVKVKASKLSKKAVKIKISKLLKITKAQGKKTFTKVKKGSKTKAFFKKVKIAKKTGKVTIAKGKLAKKTYKLKIKIKVAGNKNYKAKTIKKTVKIKVV
jgi:phi13 family phage major tail protein